MKKWIERLPWDLGRLQRMRGVLFVCMMLLMATGVAFVYSANSIRDSLLLRRLYLAHAEMALIGLGAGVALAYCHYRSILRWSGLFYLMAVVLLVLVLVAGQSRMGAKRWLFGIQPSEVAKLATIMLLARVLGRPGARRDIWEFLLAIAIVALPSLLIVMQPDLGTMLVFGPVLLAMLFAAGTAPRALLLTVLAGCLSITVVLGSIVLQEKSDLNPRWRPYVALPTSFLGDYQRGRLLDFLYPERDPYNLGWNRRQSEIAIGSGGRWGKGFLKGDQNMLGYLPRQVSANDFIFSVLAEEKGFVGTMSVLLLFAGILFPGLTVAAACRDGVGRLFVVGVLALLFSHVFINIAMTVGLLPVTGLPLPFISYGRTFMLTMAIALGLLQSVAVHGGDDPHGTNSGLDVPD